MLCSVLSDVGHAPCGAHSSLSLPSHQSRSGLLLVNPVSPLLSIEPGALAPSRRGRGIAADVKAAGFSAADFPLDVTLSLLRGFAERETRLTATYRIKHELSDKFFLIKPFAE
uniref:Uncharacterized protein n=1 Tax=Mycena chlorophos TaxID=658473 RepID=A0ABQ0LUD2_MYCCL|nr:predicted protein [Mycena chlorophos]